MGLDMTITKKWHVTGRDKDRIYDINGELPPKFDFEIENELSVPDEIYWRKFWGLHQLIWSMHSRDLLPEYYDNGVDIILTKEDFEEILYFASHNLNYFDEFSNLYELATILYYWDDYAKKGVKWIYNGNY